MEPRLIAFFLLAVIAVTLIFIGSYSLGKQAQMEEDIEVMKRIQTDIDLIQKLLSEKRGRER